MLAEKINSALENYFPKSQTILPLPLLVFEEVIENKQTAGPTIFDEAQVNFCSVQNPNLKKPVFH
jgi:hypothetical protein